MKDNTVTITKNWLKPKPRDIINAVRYAVRAFTYYLEGSKPYSILVNIDDGSPMPFYSKIMPSEPPEEVLPRRRESHRVHAVNESPHGFF